MPPAPNANQELQVAAARNVTQHPVLPRARNAAVIRRLRRYVTFASIFHPGNQHTQHRSTLFGYLRVVYFRHFFTTSFHSTLVSNCTLSPHSASPLHCCSTMPHFVNFESLVPCKEVGWATSYGGGLPTPPPTSSLEGHSLSDMATVDEVSMTDSITVDEVGPHSHFLTIFALCKFILQHTR